MIAISQSKQGVALRGAMRSVPVGRRAELASIALGAWTSCIHGAARANSRRPSSGQLHGLPWRFHHRQAVVRLQRLQLMG